MKSRKKGFTLVELIIVIAILAILGAIAVPRVVSYTRQAEHSVCNINCREVGQLYDVYLTIEEIVHTDEIFETYIKESLWEICPKNGVIDYNENQIKCSIHSEDNEDDSDEKVPYL